MKKVTYTFSVWLLKGIARLPLSVLYLFSDIMFFLMFYVVRYRHNVVLENLRGTFPDKNEKEIKKTARSFYRHFSDLIVESLKNIGDQGEHIRKRIRFTNPEVLSQNYDEGKSIILYSAHIGNWEWFNLLPVMFKFQAIAFYQPLSDSISDHLIKESRERYGLRAVPSAQAFKALKQLNDQGIQTISLVLGDQSPAPNGTMVWVPFLNRETAFLVGAGKIARKLRHEVIYPHFRKLKRGYYEVELIPVNPDQDDTSEYPYIRNYAGLLEENIRKEPALWLWSHRRWKLKPENL
ncbi:MAG: lysophospholipid acyltransferase family protein [Bacteroidales bacterium]|nr:lysophospholipid acyltransferase family protein [Bacteroidales bacterium]